MTVYFNGRQDSIDRLDAALINLQVNVLESMISAHRAASVNPKELDRSRGNGASGEPQEVVLEDTSSREESDPAHPIDGAGSRGPGGNCGSRPPALFAREGE